MFHSVSHCLNVEKFRDTQILNLSFTWMATGRRENLGTRLRGWLCTCLAFMRRPTATRKCVRLITSLCSGNEPALRSFLGRNKTGPDREGGNRA